MSTPERPPPWAGAPGYTPQRELPAHAPMPGAPPYPARIEPPPARVDGPPARSGIALVVAAAAGWALVDLGLVLGVLGPPAGPAALRLTAGLLLTVLATVPVTALAGRLVARGRAWRPGAALLATAPVFWVLRAIVTALLG